MKNLKFKKTKHFFGLFEREEPDGWFDLGYQGGYQYLFNNHYFCKKPIKLGKNDKELFYWCPNCKIVVYSEESGKISA